MEFVDRKAGKNEKEFEEIEAGNQKNEERNNFVWRKEFVGTEAGKMRNKRKKDEYKRQK